jgi:hypothetical protein
MYVKFVGLMLRVSNCHSICGCWVVNSNSYGTYLFGYDLFPYKISLAKLN